MLYVVTEHDNTRPDLSLFSVVAVSAVESLARMTRAEEKDSNARLFSVALWSQDATANRHQHACTGLSLENNLRSSQPSTVSGTKACAQSAKKGVCMQAATTHHE